VNFNTLANYLLTALDVISAAGF